MKKNLVLILTIFCCYNLFGQGRIKNSYYSNETIKGRSAFQCGKAPYLYSSFSGYYFEGFESAFPPTGWQVIDVLDTSSTWRSSSLADIPAAYEGMSSAHCQYSTTDGEDWLITPKFAVAFTDSLFFQFKLQYFGYFPDSTFILVSNTDSSISSFTTILDFYAEALNYPGDSSNWYYHSYSLSAFAGQEIFIAFVNKNTFGDGVFFDNIEIGTRPDKEVGVKQIFIDRFAPAIVSNPAAEIKNYGANTQTFDVTLNITGGYSSTKTITLASQASTQVVFDPWNALVGVVTVNVQTNLAGDANTANDTMSIPVSVLEPFTNYGWSTHDPLVIPTFGSAVTSVNSTNGSRLFCMAGYGNLTVVPDAFEYDLNFNTWSSINSLPQECTFAASATANNKVYVIGGRTLNTSAGATQIYDYTTDSWTTGAPMPVGVLNAAFGTYMDSLIYIIGGISDSTGLAYNLVQIYNTYTDTWTNANPIPGGQRYACRGAIIGDKIIVSGGYKPSIGAAVATTYIGTIDANNANQITWTLGPDHPAGKISRQGACVSVDKNSSLVYFTGGSFENSYTHVTNYTFAFDINSNTWKIGPKKLTARNLFYMAPIVHNDSIYLVTMGGNNGAFFHSEEHEWLNLGYYQFPNSISENAHHVDATIFPNPTNGMAYITFSNVSYAKNLEIKIIDAAGKLVRAFSTSNNTTVEVNGQLLSKGTYTVQLESERKILKTEKLIVQ